MLKNKKRVSPRDKNEEATHGHRDKQGLYSCSQQKGRDWISGLGVEILMPLMG